MVDLGNTCQLTPSITSPQLSGGPWPCSGAVFGTAVDGLYANSYTNVFVANPLNASGILRIQVQCSDLTTSGSFTDPTSGLQVMPTNFSSGGVFWINSGGGLFQPGMVAAAFQRPQRYTRLIAMSGDFFAGGFIAGVISQYKTTPYSGYTGTSQSPGSGSVSV